MWFALVNDDELDCGVVRVLREQAPQTCGVAAKRRSSEAAGEQDHAATPLDREGSRLAV